MILDAARSPAPTNWMGILPSPEPPRPAIGRRARPPIEPHRGAFAVGENGSCLCFRMSGPGRAVYDIGCVGRSNASARPCALAKIPLLLCISAYFAGYEIRSGPGERQSPMWRGDAWRLRRAPGQGPLKVTRLDSGAGRYLRALRIRSRAAHCRRSEKSPSGPKCSGSGSLHNFGRRVLAWRPLRQQCCDAFACGGQVRRTTSRWPKKDHPRNGFAEMTISSICYWQENIRPQTHPLRHLPLGTVSPRPASAGISRCFRGLCGWG